MIQRKENNNGKDAAEDDLKNYIGGLNTAGAALGKNIRSFFEPRFGYDFSNVRIHNDSDAAKSAQSINALAYTSGKILCLIKINILLRQIPKKIIGS
ncbi:MAG: DUF4157 domain-containing protein [Ignavibacteria bacterium]|nr:DUF4157 domain-containing protein [Ignavibacteria bacterium]